MVKLTYRIPASLSYPPDQLVSATETDIEYYLFPGDVILQANGVTFDAAWGWVPVLGFAIRMVVASQQSAHGLTPVAVLFTESDAELRLDLNENEVLVSATFSTDTARVLSSEIIDASAEFLRSTYVDLCAAHAGLAQNRPLAAKIAQLAG